MKINFLIVTLLTTTIACNNTVKEKLIDNPKEQPTTEEQIKLPNIFDVTNFSLTMNKEFTELYTTQIDEHGDMSIMWTKKINNQWSSFEPIPFSKHEYNDIDPFLSRDGKKLYFISNRENGMFEGDNAIWVANRENEGWSEPELLSETINFEGNEGFPSVANNGNIYFPMVIDGNRDIFMSRYENDKYTAPVNLGDSINTEVSDSNPAIAGDESIMIFYSAREGGYGESDLYMSRKVNGVWTSAINLGESVNSKHVEFCPYITHDKKHLFYTRWNRESNVRFMMQVRLDSLLAYR